MPEYHRKRRGISPPLTAFRAFVVGVAYLVRVVGLQSQGLWRDEVDQWRFAFEPLESIVANFTRPGWNGPLYSPMLRGWIGLTGDSVYAMRYSSVLWGVLGVAIAYSLAVRVARPAARLWGAQTRPAPHWVGTVMAVLMAGSPYLVYYAQEVKMYTWVPLLAMLALYGVDRARTDSRFATWLGVWLAATLAFYSHILAALLIPVAVLWFLLHPSRSRRPWVGGLLTLSGLTLPYLPLFSWQTALAMVPRETGYPRYSLAQMVQMLLDGWSTGIWQGAWERYHVQLVMMALCGTLAVLGLAALLAWGYVKSAGRLLAWLGLPLLVVWFVSLRGPIFTDRYMIWTAPAFYLLMAIGVVWLRCHLGRGAMIALALLLAIDGHGVTAQITDPLKPQFSKVVRSVEARREARDLLLFQIPYNHHVYEFYAQDGLGEWAEAPFTNRRRPDGSYEMDEASLARETRRLVGGYDRVWLVYSEAALWDDRELVRTWLDESYERLDSQTFHGVELYLYRRPARSN